MSSELQTLLLIALSAFTLLILSAAKSSARQERAQIEARRRLNKSLTNRRLG
jgi:hypothetical protein